MIKMTARPAVTASKVLQSVLLFILLNSRFLVAEQSESESVTEFPPVILNKCTCKGSLVLIDGECQEDEEFAARVQGRNWLFRDDQTGCESSKVIIPLNNSQFALTSIGLYLHNIGSSIPSESFCLEFSKLPNGSYPYEANLCLEPLPLQICCNSVSEEDIENKDQNFILCNDTNSDRITQIINKINISEAVVPDHLFVESLIPVLSSVSCSENDTLTKTTLSLESESFFEFYYLDSYSLRWKNQNNTLDYIPNFCLNVEQYEGDIEATELVASFCYPDITAICSEKPCIRKCCPMDEHILVEADNVASCVFAGNDNRTWFPNVVFDESSFKRLSEVFDPIIFTSPPECDYSSGAFLYDLEENEFYVQLNSGSLYMPQKRHYIHWTEYCIDNFINEDANNTNNGSEIVVKVCGKSDDTSCFYESIVRIIGFILSCCFILATLFVYLSVPEVYKKLPSKCVISESFSLFASFISIISLHLTYRSNPPSIICIAIGLVFYYTTLASFFWLNVICFDMSILYRGRQSMERSGRWIIWYSLYAWGTPLLMTAVVCVIDHLPIRDEKYFGVIRPNIFLTCNIPINDNLARLSYLYGPIALLLLINVICFIMIAKFLIQERSRNAKLLNNSESSTTAKRNQSSDNAAVCFRLFLLMGGTWLLEILSFGIGGYCWIWVVTDLVNCMRGVFVFVIFVYRKDVIQKFKMIWKPRIARALEACILKLPSDNEDDLARKSRAADKETEQGSRTGNASDETKISASSCKSSAEDTDDNHREKPDNTITSDSNEHTLPHPDLRHRHPRIRTILAHPLISARRSLVGLHSSMKMPVRNRDSSDNDGGPSGSQNDVSMRTDEVSLSTTNDAELMADVSSAVRDMMNTDQSQPEQQTENISLQNVSVRSEHTKL